jgi:molybdopterin molybdotransferase
MTMITVRSADRILRRDMPKLDAVLCPISDADGRVLREDIRADRDLPPFHRVMMDGIAVSVAAVRAGTRAFAIQQTRQAGEPPATLRNPRASCIQVMTGAVLPKGCDAVVPCEEIEIRGRSARLKPRTRVARLQYVHQQGTDRRKGALVLRAGSVLLSPQIAIAAAVGRSRIRVSASPSVAVISNGNELVELGQPIAIHQLRPSNGHGIRAALKSTGVREVSIFRTRDDEKELVRCLRTALRHHDILILSGGVSMGQYDFIPKVLARLEVTRLFHKIRQRPGKPFWFGLSRAGQPVFALPGNPVAVMVCLHRYVLPALRRAAGAADPAPERATLARRVDFTARLTYFPPVRTARGSDGRLHATPVRYNGSGDYAALGESDGFIELPPGRASAAGSAVRFHRWSV